MNSLTVKNKENTGDSFRWTLISIRFRKYILLLLCKHAFCFYGQISTQQQYYDDSLISVEMEGLKNKLSPRVKHPANNDVSLKKIKLRRCSDSLIIFTTGFFASHSRVIDIFLYRFDTSSNKPDRQNGKIEKINGENFFGTNHSTPQFGFRNIGLLYGSYRDYDIPVNAFADIFLSQVCLNSKSSKLSRKKSNFSVYQSKDKMRMYICYQDDHGDSVSRIIWVVNRARYHSRFTELIEK